MERIPYDTILEIQRKANIVDVIADYLPIEKKGKNYFAICPFHDDHNPSLSISPEKQIYTCFVCGESGNVFNFVMNYEKITFYEAVVKVASKIGMLLDVKVTNKTIKKDDRYDKYYKMFDISCKYYQNNINSVYGKSAKEYLLKRKLDDDIIKEFEIGLSLDDNNISKLLTKKGFDEAELIDIGLCGKKDNFTYDIFRNRIMFPLYNTEGLTVGFSGRIYNGESDNKYVNSKESYIFKKGELLYNYHKAIEYAKNERSLIIVEGFMDVIRLHTIGIKNVVATMGTAITKKHAELIMRLSKNVILCFDGDKAGEKATLSCLEELEKIGLSPKIIRLEDNLDPDDYILKKGKDLFLNHLKNASDKLSFLMEINKNKTDFNNYNEISNYIKTIVKELEKIDDKIVFELTLKKLSKETGVDEDTIKGLIKKVPKDKVISYSKPKAIYINKYEKAEEYLIYYMLRNVDAIILYENNVSYLNNAKLSKIASEILEFYFQKHYINVTEFTLFLEDKIDLINEVLKIDSYDLPNDIDNVVIKDYIKTIDEGILKKEIEKVKEEIKEETNVAKKVALLQKLAVLKKKECK